MKFANKLGFRKTGYSETFLYLFLICKWIVLDSEIMWRKCLLGKIFCFVYFQYETSEECLTESLQLSEKLKEDNQNLKKQLFTLEQKYMEMCDFFSY